VKTAVAAVVVAAADAALLVEIGAMIGATAVVMIAVVMIAAGKEIASTV
jgi:hypothetical protein